VPSRLLTGGASPGVFFCWVSTNGDLIDTTMLHDLQKAGGDEIRFNLSARDYDLGPVELACRMIETVAVEIPAISEDYATVRKLLPVMQKIGVRHLNLHQFLVPHSRIKCPLPWIVIPAGIHKSVLDTG
jgi:pyruvate formate-lyase activating enzyme-like uncharacterized protein